ncbi:hypothetical protein ACN42_g4953 [Penicillium freii]|uniref:Uncharacterized protein n=1 Tax=Penicillium freii TaxID=48697 RepID=A0A101MKC7_PENFR|nr:hypothetical protein ACN42_g4953 [Penicillium freii]
MEAKTRRWFLSRIQRLVETVISDIKKGSKLFLAIDFHVNSTVLHHQRIMLYIGQKEIHMHEKESRVYIHQVDNTTRATKGMHQGT